MRRLSPLDLTLLVIVVLAFAGIYLYNWYLVMSFPFAVEYEGTMYWAVDRLANHENIYALSRLAALPFYVITYPPLFMLFATIPFTFGPLAHSFAALRLVTIIATGVSAWLFYRLLKASGCGVVESATGVAYFFGFTPVFLWANIGRPDALMVMFLIASMERLAAVWDKEESDSSKLVAVLMSGSFIALACFSKQTAVVGFAASIFLLFLRRRYKSMFAYGGAFAIVFGAALSIAQLLSGGFIQNITVFGSTPWNQEIMLRYLHFMSDGDTYRMEILVAVLLYCLIVKKHNISEKEQLPYLFLAGSFMQMLYILGLPGSNGNHAILPFLAFSWWFSIILTTLPEKLRSAVLASSLIGIWALATMIPAQLSGLPKNDDVVTALDLKERLVLSEDPFINVLTGSKPAMVDCAVFTSIWERTPERFGDLRKAIDDQAFSCIVINSDDVAGKPYFWPAPVVEWIKAKYRSIGVCNGNGIGQTVFAPKSE